LEKRRLVHLNQNLACDQYRTRVPDSGATGHIARSRMLMPTRNLLDPDYGDALTQEELSAVEVVE
jgi:hypothetical protein